MASMSLQAAYDQARQWLESNDLDRAIGLAQHILEQYPDNLEAYRILGEAYLANRQLDRAQESFERVLRSDPENIPAHVGLGITSERQGQLNRAVAEFEQALEIKPGMPELRTQLLRLYTEAWGSENAQLRFSRGGLARMYAKGHMLPQAISEFRQVIADHPERFDAMVALAETLWRDGQEDEAIALCRDILSQHPELLKANLLLGYLLMSAGNQEGNRYWQAAERMDPYHSVAQALFETLPPGSAEQPTIAEWDENAWRQRRAAEQQEQIAATRPMEAVTPVGSAAVAADTFSTSWLDQPLARPAPAKATATFGGGDDFLASLLAIDYAPSAPPAPVGLDISDEDLDLNIDMAPFSLEDLDDNKRAQPSKPAASAPPTPILPVDEEPTMTPFSLADLGLSDDEIAGMDDFGEPEQTAPLAGPAAAPVADDDEPVMTPFSFADLGLSDDEIASMNDLGEAAQTTPAPTPPADDDEPVMTPFSFADLGLSDEEIASMDSLSEPEQATPPADDEPAMTPFSLADLGLSDEEIASMDSLSEPTQLPAASPPPAPLADDDEPTMTPFSLSDLGLSDEEIAGMDSLGELDQGGASAEDEDMHMSPFSLSDLGLSDDEISGLDSLHSDPDHGSSARQSFNTPKQAQPTHDAPSSGASDELPDMSDLPLDLHPFSMDELDLGSADSPLSDSGALPSSLQPFSLDDAPPQRPRVSGFMPPESTENDNAADEDDFAPETRGYSWQQASQKPETSFLNSTPNDAPALEGSIFSKLKQRHQANPEQHEPEPLPPVEIGENEHLGLFSLDDIPLRDDLDGSLSAQSPAALAPNQEPPLIKLPPPTAAAPAAATPAPEIENLEDAISSGQVQPFSFADLGLSDEEIAAMGLGEVSTPKPEAPAAATPAPEIENLEDALSAGQVQPFSFADLGLSDEEVAAMGLGDTSEQTPAAPAAAAPEIAPEIENLEDALSSGQVQPFSFADLGLSDEEVAAMGLGDTSEQTPAAPVAPEPAPIPERNTRQQPPAPQASREETTDENTLGTGELKPFSLTDLGLSEEEITALGLDVAPDIDEVDDEDMGLALTEEELEGLDGGDLKWELPTPSLPSPEPAPAAPAPADPAELEPQLTTGDLMVDRLIALGRQQGYVDISDIITSFEDPEAEAARIEEIGQLLHEAKIEIRDGDEVIDMDADYAEEEDEFATEPDQPPPAPQAPRAPEYPARNLDLSPDTDDRLSSGPLQPPADEPVMTPFSLSDLGLSDDEINALGLGEPATAPDDEPVMTPFSFSDLGLSDDEINALGLGEPTTPAQPPEPAAAADDEPVMTPFSFADLGLSDDEISALGLDEPATPAQPPEPAAAPDDEPVMTPFSFADLGLSDDEISALGLDEPAAPAQPPEPAAAPDDEPVMTPFSFADLGLSDEEISSLGLDEPAAPEQPPEPAAAPDDEPVMTPFSFADLGLSDEEISSLGLDEPAAPVEPPEPVAPPADEPVMTPFSLSDLGLSDEEIAALGLGEAVAPELAPPAEPEVNPPAAPALEIPAPEPPKAEVPIAPAPVPEPAKAEAPIAPTPSAPATPPAPTRRSKNDADDEEPIFTGNDMLDTYLHQLAADPQNDILRFAVARIGGQIGMPDLAVQHYKYLIKNGRELDQVVDELSELIEDSDSDDRKMLQKLHRMLGDAYSKQGHFREAIEEYSWTPGGPRGAR